MVNTQKPNFKKYEIYVKKRLLKNSHKRFQLSQQSREKRKKLNDNDDEIFNTISNRFDNVPYYELFK